MLPILRSGGAQILLCSEIGSEGRNFQFAHHLVLFDLSLNPELLEQRIGRLTVLVRPAQFKYMCPIIKIVGRSFYLIGTIKHSMGWKIL